jgi:hypothetical protein
MLVNQHILLGQGSEREMDKMSRTCHFQVAVDNVIFMEELQSRSNTNRLWK